MEYVHKLTLLCLKHCMPNITLYVWRSWCVGPRSEERHTHHLFSKVGFLKMEPLFLEISTSFFFSSEEDLQNLFYYAWKLQKRNPFEHRDQVSLTIEICTYVFEDGPKSVLWKKEMARHMSLVFFCMGCHTSFGHNLRFHTLMFCWPGLV